MARLPLPPTQPSFTVVKNEPDADTTALARTPHPLTHRKPRRDRLPLPGTPVQPFLTPQTIPSATATPDSYTIRRCRELGLTPGTLPTSIKREPDADAKTLGTPPPKHCLSATPSQPLFTPQTTLPDNSRADKWWSQQPGATPATANASVKREPGTDAGKAAGGKSRRCPYPHARPTAAETPTLWLNRGRLGRLLHNLTRTHRWRDAAGVFSALLPAIKHLDSSEEAHSIFVVSTTCLCNIYL
ncbi:hypothetical protein QYE76_052151 [Lolium multiflorum]|uniref:Uncharacterized protein n=1 Tax=Lolium multiflorum TaxID=4521 RepID=A0AAD8SUM1_LOLMU|nr:hypothetical protein QYE76_052151 [Lolium multiflorum]